jgi:L-ascorbate metabolism protein UlaG (beta-lactamase superfamily)
LDTVEKKKKMRILIYLFFISGLLIININAKAATNSITKMPGSISKDSLVNVTYIANEGFFISYCGKKVFIDALFPKKLQKYAAPNDELLNQMETAQSPFNTIDLILATHIHSDHFSRNSVKECLLHNSKAIFVSTPQVVQFMSFDSANYPKIKHQIKTENLKILESSKVSYNGIDVKIYRTNHSNNNFRDHNYMYLININDKKIFHEGDSDNNLESFIKFGLDKENIDIAFVHGWFAFEPKTRKILTECLKPKHTVLMHIPNDELDGYFSRIQEIRKYIPNVIIFQNSLDYIQLK